MLGYRASAGQGLTFRAIGEREERVRPRSRAWGQLMQASEQGFQDSEGCRGHACGTWSEGTYVLGEPYSFDDAEIRRVFEVV